MTDAWLSHGQMLFATAGTDSHGPWRAPERLGFNTVFAESLSERGILAGVRNGHNILSSGPRLSVSAESPGGFLHHRVRLQARRPSVSWQHVTMSRRERHCSWCVPAASPRSRRRVGSCQAASGTGAWWSCAQTMESCSRSQILSSRAEPADSGADFKRVAAGSGISPCAV